jgi:hypothetical protein
LEAIDDLRTEVDRHMLDGGLRQSDRTRHPLPVLLNQRLLAERAAQEQRRAAAPEVGIDAGANAVREAASVGQNEQRGCRELLRQVLIGKDLALKSAIPQRAPEGFHDLVRAVRHPSVDDRRGAAVAVVHRPRRRPDVIEGTQSQP